MLHRQPPSHADAAGVAGAGASRIRVLHVITGLGLGGAETVLYRLATTASDIDHEVICLTGRDWYSAKLERAGIPVHHVGWTPASAVRAAVRMHRLIKESRADVVQAWMYRANLFAGLSGRVAGKPVVWNIRCSSLEPLRPASRLVAHLGGAVARWFADFVINCSAQSVGLHDRLGYGAAEGTVIPNGYDPSAFFPDEEARESLRQSLGIAPCDFLVGTIGRWHPQKGFPIVLDALRLLRGRQVPARLLLVGRELVLENSELATLIRNSGGDEHVQAIGERPDIVDVARALDLHVLASIGSEGFPNVVAETMLSGTPNAVTDIGDAALIVDELGWVVPPGDAGALAASIEAAFSEWRDSPAKWRTRRAAARERITDNFSLEAMARAYERVWRKVAERRGS